MRDLELARHANGGRRLGVSGGLGHLRRHQIPPHLYALSSNALAARSRPPSSSTATRSSRARRRTQNDGREEPTEPRGERCRRHGRV